MKKQSRDLVTSPGHFCQSKVCLSTKLCSCGSSDRLIHAVYDHLVQGFLACQTKVYLSLHKSEQPRPQGAFPWLWEKRPGDEVEIWVVPKLKICGVNAPLAPPVAPPLQVAIKMPVFRRSSKPLQFFSAPAQATLWEICSKKPSLFVHQIEPFVPDIKARLAFVRCPWTLLRLPTTVAPRRLKLGTTGKICSL